MINRTVSITVAAGFDEVFDFLVRVENLPLWATGFCRELRLVDGRWIVSTESGDVYFAIDGIRSSGCIDMYSGVSLDEMSLLPARLMKVDSGETAVVFSFFSIEDEGRCRDAVTRQFRGLVGEAVELVKHFGGGTVSYPAEEGLKVEMVEVAVA